MAAADVNTSHAKLPPARTRALRIDFFVFGGPMSGRWSPEHFHALLIRRDLASPSMLAAVNAVASEERMPGDRGHVAADLVELDDAQRLFGTVVLQQGLETLCGSEVFEGQRTLAAVLAPQHAIRVAGPVLLGVDACHNP
jgi:hypothetical protein